jgi:hypothetical protein
MNSRPLALLAALFAALVCLGASIASADVVETEDVTIETDDTPKVRFEQIGSGGFDPYTWDIAGNEANFFIRDVTGGSHLPFRLRPGSPSNSITVAENGNVGLGLIDADAPLQIADGGAVNILYSASNAPVGSANWSAGIPADGSAFTIGLDKTAPALTLAPSGGLGLLGSLSEAATAAAIANPQGVDTAAILQKIAALPVRSWSYSATPGTRHLGPLAGDFAGAFDLGSAGAVSPADVAGVSLAGVQGLVAQNQALSTKVRNAKKANAKLGRRVGKLAKQMKKLRKAVAKLAK